MIEVGDKVRQRPGYGRERPVWTVRFVSDDPIGWDGETIRRISEDGITWGIASAHEVVG